MSVDIGAIYLGEDRCQFRVWAPKAERVELHLWAGDGERLIPVEPEDLGYYQVTLEGVRPGSRYMYRLDGEEEWPDPASRFQPEGVHCASAVIDPRFEWGDEAWPGLTLQNFIIYELHVGTFTQEGTFEAAIPHMARLRELGVTAIEIMPVSQFPGDRNWGYDGTYLFAVQNSYGGPEGFKRLVNACHQAGLAVVLDVVYNHLGPEGGYLGKYGPYFTEQYRTGWGSAINLDGPYSDEVRNFFIQNALYWIRDFHVDALRLDAVHALFDSLAPPFLEQLAETVHQQCELMGREAYLIAESDLNNPRLIWPREAGGYGLDAQWNDDFEHVIEGVLRKEESPMYEDFEQFQGLAKAFSEGYIYTGQYSRFRKRRHGRSPHVDEGYRFIVFLQNHDQVGNRPGGMRLSSLVSLEALKAAVSVTLLSPFIPLLFMGEEYAEAAPFHYFVSFDDPDLIEAVRQGRAEEFGHFNIEATEDPQNEAAFQSSKLNHELRHEGKHRAVYNFYRELLRLRQELPALANLSLKETAAQVWEEEKLLLLLRRWAGEDQICLVASFGESEATLSLPIPAGRWRKQLDTAATQWLGDGQEMPELLESTGEVELSVRPNTCALWVRI